MTTLPLIGLVGRAGISQRFVARVLCDIHAFVPIALDDMPLPRDLVERLIDHFESVAGPGGRCEFARANGCSVQRLRNGTFRLNPAQRPAQPPLRGNNVAHIPEARR